MFPKIYSYHYLTNHLNFSFKNKNFFTIIRYSYHAFTLLFIFKKIGLISCYSIIFKKNKPYLKFYLYFYKQSKVINKFKLIAKASKHYYLSIKALKLIEKRIGNSKLILSTSIGLLTNTQALHKKIGGEIVGFFCL